MSPARYVPDRGHFVWIDFDPQAGREQHGHRPALVLTAADFSRLSGLTLVCPITSRIKGYPFEVPIPGGSAVSGCVLVGGIKSLDWAARRVRFIGDAPQPLVADVLARLAGLLEIPWP